MFNYFPMVTGRIWEGGLAKTFSTGNVEDRISSVQGLVSGAICSWKNPSKKESFIMTLGYSISNWNIHQTDLLVGGIPKFDDSNCAISPGFFQSSELAIFREIAFKLKASGSPSRFISAFASFRLCASVHSANLRCRSFRCSGDSRAASAWSACKALPQGCLLMYQDDAVDG